MAEKHYPNLRAYLESEGLTQLEFARMAGVAVPTVSRLISGKRGASLRLALRIAKLAHVPVESLVASDKEAA